MNRETSIDSVVKDAEGTIITDIYQTEYYKNHKARLTVYKKKYYEKHKNVYASRQKKHRSENKEHVAMLAKARYDKRIKK